MNKKEMIYRAIDATGFNALYRSRTKRDELTVLMYHGVLPDHVEQGENNWLQVRESSFRQQMEHLNKYYQVVSLENAYDGLHYLHSDRPKVAITFDDGYRNNYTTAYPILKEFNFPATIFLVTGLVDTNHIMWYDRLLLAMTKWGYSPAYIDATIESFKGHHPHSIDAAVDGSLAVLDKFGELSPDFFNDYIETYGYLTLDQVKEMDSDQWVTLGSHTHNHEIITRLNLDEVRTTLAEADKFFEDHDFIQSEVFCSPNGNFKQDHVDIFQDLGFDYHVTTRPGKWKISMEDYRIPRIGIGRTFSLSRFASAVSGTNASISRLRRAIR